MRYCLHTLLILLAVGPPLVAGAWWGYGKWREERDQHRLRSAMESLKDDGGGIRAVIVKR